jgi:hypothetical protein
VLNPAGHLVPHLEFASFQLTPHLSSVGGGVDDPHRFVKSLKQYWPVGQELSVPNGQAVPHLEFASCHVVPHLLLDDVEGLSQLSDKAP